MTDPIAPPPELVQQWHDQCHKSHEPFLIHIANCAAQWGYEQRGEVNEAKLQQARDQELEACCEEMKSLPSPLGIPFGQMASNALRAARRPKPPSLKEQALGLLNEGPVSDLLDHEVAVIRRALESLPN